MQSAPIAALNAPREAILRRPSKWAFARQKWREVKSIFFCFTLAAVALVAGLTGYAWSRGSVGALSAGLFTVAPVWWYVEFPLARRKRRERQAATVEAVKLRLPPITFNDGSTCRFEPTDVVRASLDMIIAIDVERKLVRVITHSEWPDEGVDWIFELPDNMDLDVADYPRRRRKTKKVPSLLFSSEENGGTQVVALALAPDSVATARNLVVQLRARQRIQ